MFTGANNNSQSATFSSSFNAFIPNNSNISSLEMREGFNKALAAYTIIKGNCDTACKTTLELNDINRLNAQKKQTFDSCVRRCFVQRLKQHIPEESHLADFIYSSAFAYTQDNQFHLDSYKAASKPSVNPKIDIDGVAKSFNSSF